MLKQRAVYFSHICFGLILCDSVCCMLCLLYVSRNESFTLHCYNVCVEAVKVKYFTLNCLSFLLDTFLLEVCLLDWIFQFYMEWEACLHRFHMALPPFTPRPPSPKQFFYCWSGRNTGENAARMRVWEQQGWFGINTLERCFKITFAKKLSDCPTFWVHPLSTLLRWVFPSHELGSAEASGLSLRSCLVSYGMCQIFIGCTVDYAF